MNSFDDSVKAAIKNKFRDKLISSFTELDLPPINENRKFGIDSKKVILENILSVFEDDIPLENKGSGMESLIKTQIALDKNSTHLDVILMEEPENHLSFQNLLKMLETIEKQQEKSQIIIATHSNMIASRLNLRNVIWIENGYAKSLSQVDEQVATFFTKADNNSFLQLLLSKKAVLVEGATEYLLLPYLYKKEYGKTMEEMGITVISCNGISYKNYLSIIDETNKKIAVITDNDHKQEKIDLAEKYNKEHMSKQIFMGKDTEQEWTWEASIYLKNQKVLDECIKVRKNSKYLYYGIDYGQVLGKMLNNKVDIAYQMITNDKTYVMPDYVKDAFEWINK